MGEEVTGARTTGAFNTPIESALRVGFLLVEAFPGPLDVQQIVHFDYLLVHSADAGGPRSLHPAIPHRSGEWLVRRRFVQGGLHTLARKRLVGVDLGISGVRYVAEDALAPFLELLRAPYSLALRDRAAWVMGTYGKWTEASVRHLIEENIAKWGGEFELEAQTWEDAP
jgi:hypothetical protein